MGSGASVLLFQKFGLNTVFFWIASFMMDIDHYIEFIYRNGFKDLSFLKMFDYYAALNRFWYYPEFIDVEFFHSVEFMTALGLFSFWSGSTAVWAVFWGFLFHIAMDMLFLLKHRIFFKRAHSVIEYFIRKKRLEAIGFRPAEINDEVLRMIKDEG